jgi:WD40 repeat protein
VVYYGLVGENENIITNFFTVYDSTIYYFCGEKCNDYCVKNTLYSYSLKTKIKKQQGEIIYEFEREKFKINIEIQGLKDEPFTPMSYSKRLFLEFYAELSKGSFQRSDNFMSGFSFFDCAFNSSVYYNTSMCDKKLYIMDDNKRKFKVNQDVSFYEWVTGVKMSPNGKYISVCIVKFSITYKDVSTVKIYSSQGVLKNSFVFSSCYDARVSNDGEKVLVLGNNKNGLYNVYLRTHNGLKLIDKDCQNAFFY